MWSLIKRIVFVTATLLVLILANGFSVASAQTTLTCSRGVGLFAHLEANASVNYGVFNRRGFLELRYTGVNNAWTTLTGITGGLGIRDTGANTRRYNRNTQIDIYGWGRLTRMFLRRLALSSSILNLSMSVVHVNLKNGGSS